MFAATTKSESISDLSEYYIVKKYRHGWQLGKIGSEESKFISREELVIMGYLEESDEESNINILGTTPPSAIIVPTGFSPLEPKRKSPKNPPKSKCRADNDPNWRKSKGEET